MNILPGSISYVELKAFDLEQAQLFYQQVFGWQFSQVTSQYAQFQSGILSGGLREVKNQIMAKSGKPYQSERSARSALASRKVEGFDVVETEGGWALEQTSIQLDEAPEHSRQPLLMVYSPDLLLTAELVVAQGGVLLGDIYAEGDLRKLKFSDNQGNQLIAWSY